MVTQLVPGQRTWSATSDEYGFLDYKVSYRVTADVTDGPTNVLFTPGLPLYGSWWIIDADVNLWAWRRWNVEVKPDLEDEPNTDWTITYTFSTKWPSPKDGDRPYSPDPPNDPRLEPPRISGSFVRYTREETMDRFGNPIINSAYEVLRGPQVEFDRNRLQIKIEFNSSDLPLSLLLGMADTVNAFPLWGIPPRCIKLSEPDFELSFFGQGTYYWKIKLTFDIDLGTWDRDLLDEGTKVLNGHWDVAGKNPTGNWIPDAVGKTALGVPIPPDPTNPQHFTRFQDRNGQPARVVLNGGGLPAGVAMGAGTMQQTKNTVWMWIGNTFGNSSVSPNQDTSGNWLNVYYVNNKVSTWVDGVSYYPGSVVTLPGVVPKEYYLCIKANRGFLPLTDSVHWTQVGSGFIPSNEGSWDASSVYDIGMTVIAPSTFTVATPVANTGSPGILHVERYPGTDFSLLGIPLTLPNVY